MAEIHWLNPISGSFTNASDWSGGVVPGTSDDAILDAAGITLYTVTASAFANTTVNSIQTAANATFDITEGNFHVTDGTGAGTNAGTIVTSSALIIQGVVNNTGAIDVRPGAGSLSSEGGALTLTGAGQVNIEGPSDSYSIAGFSAVVNVDNTISGAGGLGHAFSAFDQNFFNQAKGVVDANGVGELLLNFVTATNAGLMEATAGGALAFSYHTTVDNVAGTIMANNAEVLVYGATIIGGMLQTKGTGTVENHGLIEGSGVGGLILQNTIVDGSNGGVILAGNGSHVALQGADLIGGTLESAGTGQIKVYRGANELDGTSSAVDNQAVVVVQNSTALTIQGAIVNTNQIALSSFNSATTLTVGAAGATLSGGGRVTLSNSANNIITGASSTATLANVDNLISGAGDIGAGSMTLINEAKGVIVGSQAVALVLDTGANTIVNAGRIVARGAGGVTIESPIDSSGVLVSAGGVLTVNGAVTGAGFGVIDGGTLDFTSTFTQKVAFWAAGGILELARSQSYGGQVVGFSKTGGSSLDLGDIGFVSSSEATFSGTAFGGVLTVTDGTHTAHITLRGDYRASTFTASSDGHGGTIVVDPAEASATAAHRLIAAAASVGAGSGASVSVAHDFWRPSHPVLVAPRAAIA